MQKRNTEHIEWLDLIRCVAILCVVMCHAVEGAVYPMTVEFLNSVGLGSKLFAFSMFTVGRLGVPFFLFTSGYLLLGKQYSDESIKEFWKNKWLRLFVTVGCWVVIYNLFAHFFNGTEITIISIMKQILLLKPNSMSHIWYMPMILGMYIMLPIISNALSMIEKKTLGIPMLFLVLYHLGIPVVNVLCRIIGLGQNNAVMSIGFSGGVYGLYILMGYFLKEGALTKIPTWILSVVSVVSFSFAILLQLCAYARNYNYNIWYDNLLIFVCGVATFELMSRIKSVPFRRFCFVLARYSFAIYLVHNPINMILTRYSTFITVRPLRVILVWMMTIFLSLLLSMVISKIPKVGKVILYMR